MPGVRAARAAPHVTLLASQQPRHDRTSSPVDRVALARAAVERSNGRSFCLRGVAGPDRVVVRP
jgi:hypothetical protein